MSDGLHACPKDGCPERIPFEQMACKRHWFALPPELRRRVNRAWRSGELVAVIDVRGEVEAVLNGASK